MSRRPTFRKSRSLQAYSSPEELFGRLSNRSESHGYLRAPQVDALRSYLGYAQDRDIALELPTGTGKTMVGLLIAEWCRRKSGGKAAYLSLTNQLAQQVLEEGRRLGISVADLRGTRDTRDPYEEGKYRAGESIGVTTYANLFNVNPVIQASDVLILDDAHGGENFVAAMWAARVTSREDQGLYLELLAALRPAISDQQLRSITSDASAQSPVELIDVGAHPEVVQNVGALLGDSDLRSVRYAWTLIGNNLEACLVLASSESITIRPILPPTHTHEPFFESRQRIYMSATLGSKGDLQRSYGIERITPVQAQHPQWGQRYIFLPELVLDGAKAWELVGSVWSKLPSSRALFLAPSFSVADSAMWNLDGVLSTSPRVLRARDIEDDLSEFTESQNVVLSLAGRYDGIDLPGEDCRLLVMVETPSAIGPLERHQRTHWKLGPLLRKRERTRLVQGMGRCTRDATDFAVIILLGQSLTDAMTTRALVQGLPGEIQRELEWGISQGSVAQEGVEHLVEMIMGLIVDPAYRSDANENFEDLREPNVVPEPESYTQAAVFEVKFATSLWDQNYTRALELAHSAADSVSGDELKGYRAWWLYLASVAARQANRLPEELEFLRRARGIGVNAGFLDHLIRSRSTSPVAVSTDVTVDAQCEAIWNSLDAAGWHGPRFSKQATSMLENLGESDPTTFHMGLESLGQWLGAQTIRSTEDGAPDVVWMFPGISIVFEAKTGKESEVIAKRDLLQAKAHREWLIAMYPEVSEGEIVPVVVSHVNAVNAAGRPHVSGLFHCTPESARELGKHVVETLKSARATFAGREYAEAHAEFKAAIGRAGHLIGDLLDELAQPLS